MTSGSVKRGNLRRCVFDKATLGDLAVPERVDVCPLLFERAARRLDAGSLVTHYDDGVALRDELAGLKLLEFVCLPKQGEELLYSFAPVASAGPGEHGGALQGPFHIVGQKLLARRGYPLAERDIGLLHHIQVRLIAHDALLSDLPREPGEGCPLDSTLSQRHAEWKACCDRSSEHPIHLIADKAYSKGHNR
jgi:hypothetical protein